MLYGALLACTLMSGCKRDIPPLPVDGSGDFREVTFRLSGFESDISQMKGTEAIGKLALSGSGMEVRSLLGVEPRPEPQYLYYWSFNDGNLLPDIAVDEEGARLVFEAAAEEPDYPNSTFGIDPYDGGQAFSLRGGKTVELELPLQGVESLSEFAFDISSSGTGPKAFSLSYSADGGTTYLPVVENQQFDDMGDQKRNPYQFDLSGISGGLTTGLLLKFDFLPGNREGAGEHNESQGTVRLDNIRLSGVYRGAGGGPEMPGTLRYYVFSADDGSVVLQQELPLADLGEEGRLVMKLADGSYDVLFVAYRSDRGLLLPENLTHASGFYLGQHFDDSDAVTYAALLEDVAVDATYAGEEAVMTRCYSLVEFDFTDDEASLQGVRKIEIVRKHRDFLYAPFGVPQGAAGSDTERITFTGFGDASGYKIRLHQFFGLLDAGEEISYEVTAFGADDDQLNTVTVNQVLQNNRHLRLTGKLLGGITGFPVVLDTEWGEVLESEF